jgi:hypothetical protein
MNVRDEAEVGLAVHWVQQDLISAYEDNCPLRPVKTGRQSLKCTLELESLRRGVRQLFFNKCGADNNPHSWELYREAQRRYRKEVWKASKEIWRAFCSSINNLTRSARLHRALSRDPKIRLGSLVAPSGEHTQSEGETLDLLLVTHFPNSVAIERKVLPAAAHRAKCLDWRVAAKIVTYGRVVWVIDTFAPYKSPGMDGIFPALLQRGTGGPCPLPGEDFSCLPGNWICSSHMATG